MNQALIVDVDGVLLSWLDGFRSWMSALGYRPVHGGQPKSYALKDIWPSLSEDEIRGFIKVFNDESHYFAKLPEIPGAHENLKRVRQHLRDWPTVALTSSSASPYSISRRIYNLSAFKLDEIYVTPLGRTKRPYFESFLPGSVVIEDNYEHARTAEECKHTVILLDYPYNQGETKGFNITRVRNWSEIPALFYC